MSRWLQAYPQCQKQAMFEIVPENIMGRIKTYEDARDYLGYVVRDAVS